MASRARATRARRGRGGWGGWAKRPVDSVRALATATSSVAPKRARSYHQAPPATSMAVAAPATATRVTALAKWRIGSTSVISHRIHGCHSEIDLHLKLLLKRGALLAAANWPIVAVQFAAQTTF